MGLFDAIKKAFTGEPSEPKITKQPVEVVTLYPRITADNPFQPKVKQAIVKVEQLIPKAIEIDSVIDEAEKVNESLEAHIEAEKVSDISKVNSNDTITFSEPSEQASPVEDNFDANESELVSNDYEIEKTAELLDQNNEQIHAVKNSDIEIVEEASAVYEPNTDVVASSSDLEQTEVYESEVEKDIEEPNQPTESDLDQGLNKTKKSWSQRWNQFMANFRRVDEDFFDDLEETLIKADVGAETAFKLTDELRDEVKLQNAKSKEEVSNVILQKLVDHYTEQGRDEDSSMHFAQSGPTVILFVGVNGVGKTTTIGKLAARYKQEGKKVLLAAADTFRAGATQQLQVWGERDGVEVIAGPPESDPASVVFDGVKAAIDQQADILFVDTAGRLQNNVNLMQELAKMKRIIERELPDQPAEVLLVLDSTTGQNALQQAKLFKSSTDVTGIVLTKLDGTAKGGIVLPIRNELHLPVKWIGLGEQVGDLKPFDANDFAKSLFGPLLEL
ncbi:signal recognition particle-docking protein FtsY [Weissella koreensis]|uniref:Signal recognition particle receptor FtsY n=1 Tax=Weissella koreensis TaxID=165096 RepID=A0A7H1MK69_9LACO|nr:signal recognition particle-docking protein FtsY [Weissella koreensis]AVH74597.1 signal recognition particle-docking protein FtsY [Weissella koreensis]EJF33947.1 signal recognition particle-docking protein FtsY [Weissella koreensis KCTC 3621]EJF34237.1 signal recognition particle-docking protein FtsY [Weissella koreensis KCTC 3621]QGN19821.1 signal recognition particle-docking protein FtsY [Weissella koreensis]QNT63855.1 signal recognition particle-docking protein FtsY [Weissella koreensis]